MNKKIENDWNKFNNPKEIKKNLTDASLFLAFYEILHNTIVDRIADFFNNEFKNGKVVTSKEYKETIINRKINKKKYFFLSFCLWLIENNVITQDEYKRIIEIKEERNIFLSSCLWLIENNVITQDEYKLIIEIKKERNRIAHNLPKFLFDSEYCINKDLFNQIKVLTLKIERWYIQFDIPLNSDFDEQEIDSNGIVPGKNLILKYIFDIANTSDTEFEELERVQKILKTNKFKQ